MFCNFTPRPRQSSLDYRDGNSATKDDLDLSSSHQGTKFGNFIQIHGD